MTPDELASALFEASIDYGGAPDFIDPEKKRRIEQDEHPYVSHRLPAHEITSQTYPEIVRKVERYTGLRLRSPRDLNAVMGMMMNALERSIQIEQRHKEQLEQAAVDLVLGLPEYQSLKKAVEDGNLIIKAELRPEGADISRAEVEEQPDDPAQTDLQIPEIALELNEEQEKRRFLNLLIQGSGMSKNYAYHQVSDTLNQIDPNLTQLYGTAMSAGEFFYWAVPESSMAQMGSGGMGHGSAELETNEEGVPVIHAQGLIFPLLVQELVKGLMEYLSHNDEDDPETRRHVQSKTDTLRNETWDVPLGPGTWQRVLRAIGNENQELMPHIYDHLAKLPPGEFKRIIPHIIANDAEGQHYIRSLINDIRGDQEAQEGSENPWKGESGAAGIVGNLLD